MRPISEKAQAESKSEKYMGGGRAPVSAAMASCINISTQFTWTRPRKRGNGAYLLAAGGVFSRRKNLRFARRGTHKKFLARNPKRKIFLEKGNFISYN
jgi:hypothetical protein